MALLPECADDQVADRGHDVRELSGADLAGVFAKGDITDVMLAIFYAPMRSDVMIEVLGSGQVGGQG
ncbi:hypothetical protein J2853_007894 [Streptosporangium lutulentum]|uniref:Uncharacterized protein n=1 Tax=Streptosporangium lutulentum TaxID=1461250 RepID=A0ABT9QPL3_9ACTN|nr:hypothetical protein [Streptosporangium lutulentum]